MVVGDREADIHEYFETAVDLQLDILVRLQHNRIVEDSFGEGSNILQELALAAPRGRFEVHIPGNGSRTGRTALMEVRSTTIQIQGQPRGIKTKRNLHRSDIEIGVLDLREVDMPEGQKPLCWTLLTTLPLATLEDAQEVMRLYRMRWTIEIYFKALKTGCGVEAARLDDGQKLMRYVALCSVIAWRIMFLTWLQREVPGAGGDAVLSEAEWKSLWLLRHSRKIRGGEMKAVPPNKAPDLRTITMWLGGLGGHMGRKGDGNPGMITVWRGWSKVLVASEVYEILAEN